MESHRVRVLTYLGSLGGLGSRGNVAKRLQLTGCEMWSQSRVDQDTWNRKELGRKLFFRCLGGFPNYRAYMVRYVQSPLSVGHSAPCLCEG
jgi:hypothetical protein